MSIATELSRIQADRNTIRNKLIELGLATGTDNLDKLAAAVESIINQGAVSLSIREGETVTIPAGWHNGSGTVSGIAGGGNYSLQSKTATPTKKQQNITPDSGYYGLSDVTLAPIPDAYQDVTSVTAAAGDVLTGKVYVTSNGTITAGTMTNNGAVAKTLNVTTIEYIIPKGYHNGEGKVTITLETKTVTPTKLAQDVTPSTGKVLSKVTVNPIPDKYQDVTHVTAAAGDVLTGKKIVDATGAVIDGTMADNGTVDETLTVTKPSFTVPAGKHSGEGTVKIVPENKEVTPTKAAQTVKASDGKVLDEVSVAPIPAEYQDVTPVTAGAGDVLIGKVIVDAEGNAIDGSMPDNGAFNKTLTTVAPSVSIPAGKHSGEGKVQIVPEDKTVTPTKSTQNITASNGKVLNKVSVEPIPDEYQDVTPVTAGATDVLIGKKIVDAEGTVVDGAMTNNGSVAETLDATSNKQTYTVPKGYHDGSGTVTIVLEEKAATPTKSAQDITPADGKVLSKVSIAPIPDEYQDVTPVSAEAGDVLTGKKIVTADGTVVDGSMPDNGTFSKTLTTADPIADIPAGKHSGEGIVQIFPENKSVTPTKAAQEVTASDGKVLDKVSVAPIPDEYQDVSGVTAEAADVLTGRSFVDSTGAVVAGTMVNNGNVGGNLYSDNWAYIIPKGYHAGSGKVIVNAYHGTATPTKSKQTITATPVSDYGGGYQTWHTPFLSSVVVNPIPDEYQVVTDVTAEAADVLEGEVIVDATGAVIEGTMPDNGTLAETIDGLTVTSFTIPAGKHSGTGTVSLTTDIEEALAAI